MTGLSETLRIAKAENFHLIPIRKGEKRPLRKNWDKERLELDMVKWYIKKGFNLGVVGGIQSMKDGYKLAIADFDRQPLQKISDDIEYFRAFQTLVAFTPRGFHTYWRTNSYKLPPFLTEVHRSPWTSQAEVDNVRFSSMYVLIPPSKVGYCECGHSLDKHDSIQTDSCSKIDCSCTKYELKEIKSYWWLDSGNQIIRKI